MTHNDMLVKLYKLKFDWNFMQEQAGKGIDIGKPIGPDRQRLLSWIKMHFPKGWQGELEHVKTGSENNIR